MADVIEKNEDPATLEAENEEQIADSVATLWRALHCIRGINPNRDWRKVAGRMLEAPCFKELYRQNARLPQ
jgi:hypothetical protein